MTGLSFLDRAMKSLWISIPSKLPALPKGWVRDYFFVANGYEKDMDFYAYDFTSVDPLPFGDMNMYPYPEANRFLSMTRT